jgi:hypothetical protein
MQFNLPPDSIDSTPVAVSQGPSDELRQFVKTASRDPFLRPKNTKARRPAANNKALEPIMDPVLKQKRKEYRARCLALEIDYRRQLREKHQQGKKKSKALIYELKAGVADISRKLKPVTKQEKRKFVDPDRPYREELEEVQNVVLPVWREETYAYWI